MGCVIMKKIWLLGILLFFLQVAYAMSPASISLDLQEVNLPDALRIFAKFLQLNLVISPLVSGNVSLHLHEAVAADAFEMLLASQGLAKRPVGSLWLVAPVAEIAKHQLDELRLREMAADMEPLATHVWQIHYAKAEDILHIIQNNHDSLLSKRGQAHVDIRTNTLCIHDVAARIAEIQQLMQRWDVPVQQVLIEARLASVDSDFERQLGINFTAHEAVAAGHHGGPEIALGSKQFSLVIAKLADGSILDVALSALEKDGHGELISSPSLFTANQQTASIESGEEIPYQEVSQSGATSVAFKKAVLSLKVTPQIMPGNKVMLQLQVNQDRPNNRIVLGVPAISTRQITTNILVKNRQTIVLGGIYEQNKEHGEQRIPFLGKIPLVGFLFQQHNASESKRELLIFVTPKIISQD
jgi:type IV pilus assembly protein PilQ